MNDIILKSYLEKFSEKFDLAELPADTLFEYFVNYNLVSKSYPKDLNIEILSTRGSHDIGIDGIAILVNGILIEDEDEIEGIVNQGQTLDVEFILIQSKNQRKFEGSSVSTFLFGVKTLFEEAPSINENECISKIRKIKEAIYKNSISFDEKPTLKLYYATVGEWKNPTDVVGRSNSDIKTIENLGLFKNIDMQFIDAEKLKRIYKELSGKVTKEILFSNHVALPDLPEEIKVRQSFIGSVSIKDYIDFITDSDKKLYRSLFYDNVRDFQGKNKVNQEIRKTLSNQKNKYLIPLLNNGITIISKKVDKVGQKIKLSDFQIVNGCQTSHILFEEADKILDDLNIIVKVIETTDQEVINNIIIATNRQTEVKDEAFESIKPFHRNLDEYFKANFSSLKNPIYYERRSKEYFNDPKVRNDQIITLSALTKAYIATILEQPQSTHRYFGELIASNNESIFKDEKMFPQYFTAAFIVNRIQNLFKQKKLDLKYKPYIFQIAFIFYFDLKRKNKKTDDQIWKIVDNDKILLEKIKGYLNEISKISNFQKNNVRSKDFTQKLKMHFSM